MKNASNIQDPEPTERIKVSEIVTCWLLDTPGVIWLYNTSGTLLEVIHHENVEQRLAESWKQRNSGPFAYAVSAAVELFVRHEDAISRAQYAIQEFKPEANNPRWLRRSVVDPRRQVGSR